MCVSVRVALQEILLRFLGFACTDACRGCCRCVSTAGENAEKRQDMPTAKALAQHADAPMLCWEARASLMMVVLTVVERMMADEGEVPIVELRHIVKSLLHNIVLWACNKGKRIECVRERSCEVLWCECLQRRGSLACMHHIEETAILLSPQLIQPTRVDRIHSDSKLLAFGIGALSHLVLPLRERHEEFRVRSVGSYARMCLLVFVARCAVSSSLKLYVQDLITDGAGKMLQVIDAVSLNHEEAQMEV